MPMDTLLRGGTVVLFDEADGAKGARAVQADVRISGARIASIELREPGAPQVPTAHAERGPRRAVRVIDAEGCAVIPGFVQAHVHLCQALFRGMADDRPLLAWLEERIWPLEAAHDPSSLRASAELGLLEMMTAGTTGILDMGTVHDHDVVFEACVRSGIRAKSGKAMMDRAGRAPKRLQESCRASLDESERLARTWNGAGQGRMGYAYAPRFILSCSEALVRGAAERAEADGSLVHTHVAEHKEERDAVRAMLGDEDVSVLRAWGVRGPRAILAHGVQLEDHEARTLAAEGTRIIHCPSANLKLGSGIARIAELDAFGVQLGLGADGAPCNNRLDPWTEMRSAALLAKVRTGVTALPAWRALRLATFDGAKALGLGEQTGSIAVGKRADLAVVRLDAPGVEPGGDVFSKLVYACSARDVAHVFVDGAHVVRGGEHVVLDAEAVVARARAEGGRVFRRAIG